MFTKQFWKGLGERAIKTFLQSFFGSLVALTGALYTKVGQVLGLGDLKTVGLAALTAAGLATLGSIATSFGSPAFTAGLQKPVLAAAPADAPAQGNQDEESYTADAPALDDAPEGNPAPEHAA